MPIDRRSFLVASAAGYAGLHLGSPRSLTADERNSDERNSDERNSAAQQIGDRTAGGGTAKSVILFFLCGGASHIDTWT